MSSPAAPQPPVEVISTESPPTTLGGILTRLGPGLIIAASIVGSGELIATTKTGAEAGYSLLWLVLIGCMIKVFVQVEFGRYAVAEGVSTIDGLDRVPGPRWRVSWLVWAWLGMFVFSAVGQLGGILGVVGQLFAMKWPIYGDFNQRLVEIAQYRSEGRLAELPFVRTWDDVIYSFGITVVTAVMLVAGRYKVVQHVSTVLVAAFTGVTVFNVMALPFFPAEDVQVGWSYLWGGLTFGLPDSPKAVTTALATFGIIGVGASELIAYPYWCLEHGYARFTGPRDATSAWSERARGWMRVMHYDCWCSMIIYTFATMAFYILGAAVLHPQGRIPDDQGIVPTLSQMYANVFPNSGDTIFFFGAFAVLYSTLFVATAGNARVAADAMGVYGLIEKSDAARRRWVMLLCGALPVFQLLTYYVAPDPVTLVIIAGLSQSLLLPLLGYAALHFRYRHCDARIAPGRLWDVLLWVSVCGLALAGMWGAYSKLPANLRPF